MRNILFIKTTFLFLFSLLYISVVAQLKLSPSFQLSGYGDFYYSYDFSNPSNHEKPSFIYNHKRHNELNINLAFIKAAYNDSILRSNIAFMVGNYPHYNFNSEPTWVQFIYEANVGIKLSSKKNIWLDIGILPSHIGFESAVSADCWTPSRSILAENSPYVETGAKLSYQSKNDKLALSLLALNGWQRMYTPNFISTPSLGMQFNYKPSNRITLNYSNFIGTDKVDSLNALRVFHNLYALIEQDKHWGFILGFDFGTESNLHVKNKIWYSPVLITRYTINASNKIAGRIEYYHDPSQIIVTTNANKNFRTIGYSLNYDRQIRKDMFWRIEGKLYQSSDDIFSNENSTSNTNFALLSVVSIKL